MTYETILEIVTKFYDKAINDVLIGYHFRHIENFDEHIPRIAHFWELQLLGKCSRPEVLPFDLFSVHQPLQMKKAQLRRWVILFEQTLQESDSDSHSESIKKWQEKIFQFQEKFIHHPFLFNEK